MIPAGARVFVATKPVDFRKGPASLMALVKDSGADPFSGALYVFRAKRADRVKIVWWDGTGLCLFAKLLDEHGFHWPRIEDGVIRLSAAQLMALVEGMDWKRGEGGERAPTAGDRLTCGLVTQGQRKSGTNRRRVIQSSPMNAAATDLPDDAETLKAMLLVAQGEIAHLKAVNADAEARMARLTALLKALERARYGRRSETLDPDQHAFAFEEIETGLAAIGASLEAAKPAPTERAPRQRKGLPAHLPRIEVVVEPDAAPCACGSCDRVKIGEDVSERLDVVPATFRVIVTRRPRYACKACREGIVQAKAPARLIDAGLPTEALLAQIAVSKYADGLPLYRQEAIYARDGVDLSRSLMAAWMGRLGIELEPLAGRVFHHIRAGRRVFADETTLPTLSPGRGKTKTGWLWTYARDDRPFGGNDPPMVAYCFEDGRGGEHPMRHLAGFAGMLQVDGYTAYKNLADPARSDGPVTLVTCWAHLRRKFYELHIAGQSDTATWTVERMVALWRLEDEVRGQSAEVRQTARAETSASIVAELFAHWERELARIPGKWKVAEVIRYALARRTEFERFLHDGRLDIDSNIVERAIRPQTITRKNALFAGSDGGGKTWATIATLLSTAKLNGVDPQSWLTKTLERLAADWPNRLIDDLMPWNHQAA